MCPQCARSTQWPIHRFYSVGAASAIIQPPMPGTSGPPPITTTSSPQPSHPNPSTYRIKSGVILTRPPLLTREQTPFESAFYLYQKRLDERLSAPFRKAFYFKLDTPAELDWRFKVRARRGTPARDIGQYNPRSRMAWNDEVLEGSPLSDPAAVVERIIQDAEMCVNEEGEEIPEEDRIKVERPLPRRTEADEKGDMRRLDRRLDRTLYLVVKTGDDGAWEFPSGPLGTSDTLHEVSFPVQCPHGIFPPFRFWDLCLAFN